jgi:hypothetical protein
MKGNQKGMTRDQGGARQPPQASFCLTMVVFYLVDRSTTTEIEKWGRAHDGNKKFGCRFPLIFE